MRQFFGLALAAAWIAGCTETPSYFPPCVSPYGAPCPVAEAEAPDSGAAAPQDGASNIADGSDTE